MGLKVYHAFVPAGCMVYVPQGWLIIEIAKEGGPLFYGLRKSFFEASPAAIFEAEKCQRLLIASGCNSARQADTLKVLKATAEAEAASRT